jgi:hypothetical protein
MKKIDLSSIATNVGMPIKSGVMSHLQSAYQEVIDAIVKGSIGGSYDPTKFYVLYGCLNSTTAPIYTVSAGAIFFNGEIYLVDAFTFTATGSNVAVGTITTTFFSGANADPITFTDSVARNVLQIRKIVFSAGASGSGDVDFEDMIYINEEKLFIGTTGAPAFLNTWANLNSGLALYIQKTGFDVVISGAIQKGTFSTSTSFIFNLPLKYRPIRNEIFTVAVEYLDTNNHVGTGILSVNASTGDVSILVDYDFIVAADPAATDYPYVYVHAILSLR